VATRCTLFAIRESELHEPQDEASLPSMATPTTPGSAPNRPRTLDLGSKWSALHVALGNHRGDHPMAFLATGGDRVPMLDDGPRSSGRYFTPWAARQIDGALAHLDDDLFVLNVARRQQTADVGELLAQFKRVRRFVRETVTANLGFVVHLFA
jgi:hypothetical protein